MYRSTDDAVAGALDGAVVKFRVACHDGSVPVDTTFHLIMSGSTASLVKQGIFKGNGNDYNTPPILCNAHSCKF
jgi:hypothetical protein